MKKSSYLLIAALIAVPLTNAVASNTGYMTSAGSQTIPTGVNLSNNEAFGLVTYGETSSITHGGDLQVNNNGWTGVTAWNGALDLTMEGGTLNSNNNIDTVHDEGFGLFALDGSLTVNNANIQANNNGMTGVFASTNGIITINGDGSQKLTATNNHNAAGTDGSGMSANGDGAPATININDMNVDLIDNVYGMVARAGTINITGSDSNDLNITGSDKSGIYMLYGGKTNITGMDDVEIKNNGEYGLLLTQSNSKISIVGNKEVEISGNGLGAISAADGSTVTLENATISGAIAAENSVIDLTNSKWSDVGESVIGTLNADNSVLNVRGGDVTIDTLAGADTLLQMDTATTLDITTSSGNFLVDLRPATGVHTDGAIVLSASGAEFELINGDAGAFQQELVQDGGNWVLNTDTTVTTDSFTLAQDAGVYQLAAVRTANNNLRKRIGNLRGEFADKNSGFWIRGYGKHADIDANTEASMNIYGLEFGYDYKAYNTPDDSIYLGIMGGYQHIGRLTAKQTIGANAKGEGNMPTVGLYATWFEKYGMFADFTLRYFMMDMELDATLSGGSHNKFDIDRSFVSSSIEFGKRFDFYNTDSSRDNAFALEPKMELQYIWGNSGDVQTSSGFVMDYDALNSLVGRAALAGIWTYYPGHNTVWDLFAEVGYSYDFIGKAKGKYAGVAYETDLSEGMLELSIGTNVWIRNGLNAYMEVGYETSDLIDGVFGHLGFKYNF